MTLWWKDYFRNWKVNLFMILQILFVFALLNIQIYSIMFSYNQLKFAEMKDDNLYIYQNAMGVLSDEFSYDSFENAKQVLMGIPGMEEVGYQAQALDVEIKDYIPDEEEMETNLNILSPLMWQGYQYRLEEGRWFTESDSQDAQLQIIIGGLMSKKYKVGDHLTLQLECGNRDAVIIGDMGPECYMFDFNYWSFGQTFSDNAQMVSGDVILTNDVQLEEELREDLSYPALSTLVKIKEGSDMTPFEKYGRLVSFDKMWDNTKEESDEFAWIVFKDNAMWILVIIFGIAGTSYLIAKKRRYQWGIYSLLGVSGNRLLANMMLQNLVTYSLGMGIIIAFYPIVTRISFIEVKFSKENWFATIILFGIIFIVSYLCNHYIRHIEPKEILTQTKE